MTTTTPAPQLGQTCNVGTGKTRWEIIKIDDGHGKLHLSKVGGDGYTNRWAAPDEITNVQPKAMNHTLGDVLNAREEAAAAAQALADQVKRHAKPSALTRLQSHVMVTSNRYIRVYAGHLAEIQFQEGVQA